MRIAHGTLWKARMIFWGTLLVLIAWLLWYMAAVPGKSYSGPLPPLSEEQAALRDNLRTHVFAVGGRERNLWQPHALEAAARYIEDALAGFGYTPSAQRFTTNGVAIRNIEVVASFRRHAQFPSEGLAAPAFIPGVDCSDHWSFWDEGYPALMVTDTAPYRYPYYHSSLRASQSLTWRSASSLPMP
jgi:hypothetical protein